MISALTAVILTKYRLVKLPQTGNLLCTCNTLPAYLPTHIPILDAHNKCNSFPAMHLKMTSNTLDCLQKFQNLIHRESSETLP